MQPNLLLTAVPIIAAIWFMQLSVPAAESAQEDAKSWTVQGKVTDREGRPIQGAKIVAHCGFGSLLPTGSAVSDAAGYFDLRFGPGIRSSSRDEAPRLQAATISVHKSGWFEKNLHRQGDLLAAYRLPAGGINWGNKGKEDVILPGKPRTLHFVLLPAASLTGKLIDSAGQPLCNIRLGLTGKELPPSSSVLQEVRTDPGGRFEFENVPTGYQFQLYAEYGRVQGTRRPSVQLRLQAPKEHEVVLQLKDRTLSFRNGGGIEVNSEND
jgi:hypothetical protein